MFLIDELNYTYDFPYQSSCQIFSQCIIPVITYGSQIWCTCVKDIVENVELKFGIRDN